MDRLQILGLIAGWVCAVLGTLCFLVIAPLHYSHSGSTQYHLERAMGYTRVFFTWRWLTVAILGWSLVYLLH